MAETSPLVGLFGDVLLSHEQEKLDTKSLASKPYLMIYFSAHWCPPCRNFTPELAKYYKTHKDSFNFELIFVSWDKNEQSWKEYWDSMPWLALPYDKRDIQTKLSEKFKVQGIPTLVVIDNQGETITTKGRSQVSQAPTGFPWMPKKFPEIFTGEVTNSTGNKLSLETLKESKAVVGIYFSAHWCPPCRRFTPTLAATYKTLKANSTNFEVIFVSSDKTEEDYQAYLAEMPWYSFGFKDARGNQLSDLFDVESLPTLFIVEAATGKVITDDATMIVPNDPEGKEFPWHPKLVNPVSLVGKHINSDTCFIYLDSSINEEQIAALTNAATSLSTQLAGKEELKFFYWSKDPIVERIQKFISNNDDPTTIVLNIGKNVMSAVKGKVTTEEEFKDVITKYAEGKLTSQKIKNE